MSDYIRNHLSLVMLVGAYFVPFAAASYVVIVSRAVVMKMRRAEIALFVLFVVLVAVELLQLFGSGRSFGEESGVMAWHRYLAAVAPLLWIFAAKGASHLWTQPIRGVKAFGRIALVVALGWVLLKENWVGIFNYKTKIQSHDTEVAVARLAPKIQWDYLGPRKQYPFKRSRGEYFSGRRPVISCPFGAAGWAVRGDHCRTTGAICPYPEDYLCFPMGSHYAGITNVVGRDYQFVASAPGGLGTLWVLYRRRTTPGRAK